MPRLATVPLTCTRCKREIEAGTQYRTLNRPAVGSPYHLDCPSNTPDTPPVAPSIAPSDIAGALSTFAAVLGGPIAEQAKDAAVAAVSDILDDRMNDLEARLAALVAKSAAPVLTVKVEHPSGEVRKVEGAHNRMPELIRLLARRAHVYLYGPHGSGKSTAASQAAESLGLRYGYISLTPQTPESRLLGYMDAHGKFVFTDEGFRDLYENGGVFCIDELDNAHPALLTALNGAIENGHASFPDHLLTCSLLVFENVISHK